MMFNRNNDHRQQIKLIMVLILLLINNSKDQLAKLVLKKLLNQLVVIIIIGRSADTAEDDRQKYVFENEKIPYANGTSAIINMPIVSPPKRLDSKIERVEMPTVPTKYDQRSRSPSPTTTDTYRQQTSRERLPDISGK